ncbi:hypothetical protein NEF87_001259 [Candidatus Lokiarchaeum ossiferum]|uniref:Uncharacterized protein n=1 Tax=Candidatus Lokiarchaeum ossiferum TaxID=2951803 RepID=A0ABY6HQX1_9ARCH|nr:hypothetical protein NEF87_001259 [Candidatus Lokiarchaeum sp. B-35]
MQLIAMGKIKEYLLQHLPHFFKPVLFISTRFYPGCPKCSSMAIPYYVELKEFNDVVMMEQKNSAGKFLPLHNHKFPFPVIFSPDQNSPLPSKIFVGTRDTGMGSELAILKLDFSPSKEE